ncbi:MerR family transcriptional regulator [uncultured Roseobacter sp.]|uniref:MerR family transcriptional regulator n=1 Tax=uncultured Roseobacter sp. TaxID=114847 RepID=UPI00261314F8|nr:MerR family transcriptional regulator [uncultured Roseobacter sp.]
MRIGQLAKQTGFSRDAIRFYEKQGLLTATAREGDNNYKSYPEDAVLTLQVIRDAQAAGMSIGDLSIFLSQLNPEDSEAFDGDAFLASKIAEVEARLASTSRFLDTLRQTRDALRRAPLE